MFVYKENFLTPEIIAEFDKYCELSDSDGSSNDLWNPRFTKYGDNVECFTQNPTDSELRLLKDDIYNNKDNPLYQNKHVRNLCVAIQKYPQGAVLKAHKDSSVGAVTIFLNKEWDINDGGMFHWIDDNAEGKGHCVIPKYNSAIVKIPNDNNINDLGQEHWVTEILGEQARSVIQLFIWGHGDPNNTLLEGSSNDN